MEAAMLNAAAFGRLCVETDYLPSAPTMPYQPPSGGCVLKQGHCRLFPARHAPAAFGRLCVETLLGGSKLAMD